MTLRIEIIIQASKKSTQKSANFYFMVQQL